MMLMTEESSQMKEKLIEPSIINLIELNEILNSEVWTEMN